MCGISKCVMEINWRECYKNFNLSAVPNSVNTRRDRERPHPRAMWS